VSPDQIDAATNAVVNLTAAVDTYGPGIGVSAAALAWTGRRITGRIKRQRRARRDRAAAAWIQCTNPPRRQTAPGTDIRDLRTCQQILRATEAREETP
jgi:hypothetical protein